MNRLLVLVALLLAFASLGGSAFAYARGGEARVLGADTVADVLCVAVDGDEEIAAYRPCARKLNGSLMLCPDLPQLMPGETVCALPYEVGLRLPLVQERDTSAEGGDGWFRPPRA